MSRSLSTFPMDRFPPVKPGITRFRLLILQRMISQRLSSFKVHLSDGSSKLWISVGVVSGAGVIFTAMCQKGNENR